MKKTCYISNDKKCLTNNIEHALQGRVTGGERQYIFLEDFTQYKKHQRFFEDSLHEAVAHDILAGCENGCYFLDGAKVTDGFSVGGLNIKTPKVALQNDARMDETEKDMHKVASSNELHCSKASKSMLAGNDTCKDMHSEETCKFDRNNKAHEVLLNKNMTQDAEKIAIAIEALAIDVKRIAKQNRYAKITISFWKALNAIFLGASTYYLAKEEDRAAIGAFNANKEWAYYDIAHDVSVYLKKNLLAHNATDSFVHFKSSTYKFRHGNKQQKTDLLVRWYADRTFTDLT